jgi:hypothetical protein
MAAIAVALFASVCSAQDAGFSRNVLTNRDIVTLANAGFDDEFIVETITTSRTQFDTTPDGMADLAKHGIKEDIIRAMRSAHPSTPGAAPAAFPAEAASGGRAQPVRVFVESSPSSPFLSQTHPAAEIVKAFGRNCPGLTVTSRREAAAFTVLLERAPGKLLHPATTRMVVFDRAGDMVFGARERALGKAVRGFCASAPSVTETNGSGRLPDGGLFAR